VYKVDFAKVEGLFKNPKRVPWEVLDVLQAWAEQVEKYGLSEVRKIRRYYDHALKFERSGQRAISLSYQWRAIYTENKVGEIIIIKIEEVTPHDYRKK
jgi:hypothetical protein